MIAAATSWPDVVLALGITISFMIFIGWVLWLVYKSGQ